LSLQVTFLFNYKHLYQILQKIYNNKKYQIDILTHFKLYILHWS